MNRRKTLLTTSVLTLAFGVAPATVWIYRHKFSASKRSSTDLPLAAAQVVSAAEQQQQEDTTSALDKVFTKDGHLSYKGFTIEKFQDKGEESWSAALKKGNRTIARFENGWKRDWTSFGLFPFLSSDPKQLVVEQYSGGAHCCYSYWIYDLSAPDARLLFDSGKYGTGNQLVPVDIDGDGEFEFKHSVMAFDYFNLSHASSTFPQAIFAYDKTVGEYRPANRRFSAYALTGIEKDIKDLESIKARGPAAKDDLYTEIHFSALLQVTLKYIYAGRRDEGWAIFDREYVTHEGISREKMRAEIEETLQAEPVYKYIYSGEAQ
jgi:hypothetical protein